MPIQHTLLSKNWLNGFATDSAILNTTPYSPEVLISGTFNPNTEVNNEIADFFYGRNWFWPAFKNLINNHPTLLVQRRDTGLYLPVLDEVFDLCCAFKFSFADLIKAVLHKGEPEFKLDGNIVSFETKKFNLINDGHLAELNAREQVSWNTEPIKAYLRNTTTINTVYFTRKPAGVYSSAWHSLSNFPDYGRRISFKCIYTPSGQALPSKPRIKHLLHHWLYNDNPNYCRLDHQWLINKGIQPDVFL